MSGFAFVLGDERVVGEVTGKQEARQRFERALATGHTAALLEQDRSSLFTQRVGNVPPGSEVVAEVVVDQPLRWLAPLRPRRRAAEPLVGCLPVAVRHPVGAGTTGLRGLAPPVPRCTLTA